MCVCVPLLLCLCEQIFASNQNCKGISLGPRNFTALLEGLDAALVVRFRHLDVMVKVRVTG